jgi:hypothetical protein
MVSKAVKRAIIVLFVLAVTAGVAALAGVGTQVGHLAGVVSRQDQQARVQAATITQLRTQQLAGCAFAADLGSVPIPDKPRPSRLGVLLVTDSRAQWRGAHCPGKLPVPPGLAKWARYYHLPVS